LLVISIVRGPVSFETSHATGLSAVVAGMIEALFSPIHLVGYCGRVRCCDVVNAKDFQELFYIARLNDAFGLAKLELSSRM
jgi:hypothetical protein